MMKYPSPQEYVFVAGPYVPPKLRCGTIVRDEWLGDVKVIGMTEAPIPWPACDWTIGRHKGPLPILTGGLVRAVAEEMESALAYYWGVTRYVTTRWRRAIAGANDPNAVAINLAVLREDPEFRKRWYETTL
ncbi:MAG: hypothetical protein ACYDH4_11250 [Candidatus Cryosericum sp.]